MHSMLTPLCAYTLGACCCARRFFQGNDYGCGFMVWPTLGITALQWTWNFDFQQQYIGAGERACQDALACLVLLPVTDVHAFCMIACLHGLLTPYAMHALPDCLPQACWCLTSSRGRCCWALCCPGASCGRC